jgi:folate-binding protein YgfZ
VGAALDAALWQWSEVRSGIVTLSTPVIDAFVPQMINYESVGGVNFKKGCYPGQEVVARSQFRGTLKRRTYLVQADATGVRRAGGLRGQRCRAARRHRGPGRAGARRRLGRAHLDADLGARGRRPACRHGRRPGCCTVEPLPYPLLEDI